MICSVAYTTLRQSLTNLNEKGTEMLKYFINNTHYGHLMLSEKHAGKICKCRQMKKQKLLCLVYQQCGKNLQVILMKIAFCVIDLKECN